jgi:acetylornithine aminotransferase/acetylornithine/N-succinyldiaminopimelate aminotransferase
MSVKTQSPELPTYTRWGIEIARGEGVWVYDSAGKKYLDLYGGHAVASTGHAHPKVAEAIARQARTLLFYSNVVALEVRTRAAQAVVRHAPAPLASVFFVNSGSEANENAMRLARRATGRRDVVTFSGAFHGRTADAISGAGLEKYRALGEPNVPGHRILPFGDLEAAQAGIDESVACVMLEPIQSLAGVILPGHEFFHGLRGICDATGARLVYDEVQTGFGRTGTFYFAGRHRIVPDMVTLAKGIGSGMPAGAVIVSEEIAAGVLPEEYGTTFGGGPLACAAIEATAEVIEEEGLLERVQEGEKLLRAGLAEIPAVREVRGLGYLLGVVLDRPGKPVREALLKKGVLVGGSDLPDTLRLLPPLVLGPAEIDLFLETLESVL